MTLRCRCAYEESNKHLKKDRKGIWAALEAPGGPSSQHFPHNQAQIERAGMNEQSLDDVAMTPQVSSSHAPCLVHMGKASFHQFSTLTQESLSAVAPDPSSVLTDR